MSIGGQQLNYTAIDDHRADDLGDGSHIVSAIIVANENGYGEGLVEPWYEHTNWVNNNGFWTQSDKKNQAFFNDSGLDRDLVGFWAYYNWEQIIGTITQYYNDGLDFRNLGGKTVVPAWTGASLFGNIKAFFANFLVCRIIHSSEVILVRRPLAAIPRDGQGMPTDTEDFVIFSDVYMKNVTVTKLKPKQILICCCKNKVKP